MIAEYKDADDDIVRWQSEDGTVKTAHINDLILAYETKRGKWINDGKPYALYKCSVCNNFCPAVGYAECIPEERMYKIMKYCPNCGAQMQM